MKKLRISQADLDDANEILDLQKVAYQSEAALYNDFSIPPLTQTREEIRKEFESMVFLKATYQGRIIGSVRASTDGDTCFIGRLIVHPDFQRQRIGTQLMERIERHFPTAGRFELFTGERSENNIRFYRNLGYQEIRTKKLTDKVVIIFMEKKP
ncbi:MAG: GNAT family N-acetyltransferase [Sedimentisphaerales bacterium]|nr:GNAT family N-acetyltransferase [Sedimentisphaerales bacterium]